MIEIREETADCIDDYATVPMTYLVSSRLRVSLSESGLAGATLTEEPVVPPWEKDYDHDYGDASLSTASALGSGCLLAPPRAST